MNDIHLRVAIIGAGFGGLAAAIRLREEGIENFAIFERAEAVGGTWQANTYPGAQCDIPSILYSFSFAPNPEWTRLYPMQAEIQQYLTDCATEAGITDRLHLNTEVLTARWEDDAQHWRIETSNGTTTADMLVAAMGPFSEPSVPNLPGLADFTGETFHSAQWDHDRAAVAGKRVAVVGTGASAVQFIPRLQPDVAHMTVFQRTPTWILPHPDRPLGPVSRTLFSRLPSTQRAARAALNVVFESMTAAMVFRPAALKIGAALGKTHLRRQVADPRLREQLTPRYAFGCKRPTFSNAYYPALAADNVEVVSAGIERVDRTGVVTADGSHHEVDTIVFGTGFNMTGNSGFSRLIGRDGRSLADQWADDGLSTYLGTTIANFPNMIMVLGPNSALYTSQVVTVEAQVEYLIGALRAMDTAGASSVEVRPEVQKGFVAATDRRLEGSVWNSGGCSSYYLADGGRNFTFWPGLNRSFRREMSRFALSDYIVRERATAPTAPMHAQAGVR